MRVLISIVVVVLVIAVVAIMRSRRRSDPAAVSVPRQTLTLEQKLEVLSRCGLTLADPFTPEDLLSSWDRKDFEQPGYDLTLVGLGMTEERRPWRNHCVNLWHFDTECITDLGDYKQIVERMAEMTRGSLPLENTQDYVDLETQEAWFSFTFRGRQIKVECTVEDDWVDTNIFTRFVELLDEADADKIYIYYDLGGQDCIIGCVTKAQLKELNRHGIKCVPLT